MTRRKYPDDEEPTRKKPKVAAKGAPRRLTPEERAQRRQARAQANRECWMGKHSCDDQFWVVENDDGQLLSRRDEEGDRMWLDGAENSIDLAEHFSEEQAVRIASGHLSVPSPAFKIYIVGAAYHPSPDERFGDIGKEAARKRVLAAVSEADLKLLGIDL
jgi:hypothetical protein